MKGIAATRRLLCFSLGLSFVSVVLAFFFIFRATEAERLTTSPHQQVFEEVANSAILKTDDPVSRQVSASIKPMLRWPKVAGAVSYELELFDGQPQNATHQINATPFFSTKKFM